MKCTVCRSEAEVRLPAHNSKFCREHFDQFFLRQVEKAISGFRMLERGARVLVGVSGGKDSLTVADVLDRLGYEVVGLHLDLGIDSDDFSAASRAASERLFSRLGRPLHIVSLREEFGRAVPEVVGRFSRPCAVCGLTKRHLLNEFAWCHGFDALATGHHLDDLSATLLANVLRWDTKYLRKTLPALPGGEGLAAKIKPLAFLTAEEIRTYARFRNIEPVPGNCPYSQEAKFKRYARLLDAIERDSPGTKRAFYANFLRVAHLFAAPASTGVATPGPTVTAGRAAGAAAAAPAPAASPPEACSGGLTLGRVAAPELPALRHCRVCGSPTPSEVCAFCRIWRPQAAVPRCNGPSPDP
ncbi:MAG: tRNA 2-thiocytidine biosynthesis protein TtcA [Firmicutes bacterium]|nr:tRNA 2-thiocytidine biosynthesis protein TtcA [Bacillota bacterium]